MMLEKILPLTPKQRAIYEFIAAFINMNGYAPSLEEIADMHGLRALATVHKHLVTLEHKGYIIRDWNRSRSIRLVILGASCPTCGHVLETTVQG